jgi:hypothetical protein
VDMRAYHEPAGVHQSRWRFLPESRLAPS